MTVKATAARGHGPFVMNTRAELLTAFEDFQVGRLGVIPNTSHPGRTRD